MGAGAAAAVAATAPPPPAPAAATPALPEPVPMQCAISGCDFTTRGRMPMVAPCRCGHIVCHKCLEVWAGMPNPAPCLACGAKAVAPFEVRECSPATGVLVVLVAQQPVKDGCVELVRGGVWWVGGWVGGCHWVVGCVFFSPPSSHHAFHGHVHVPFGAQSTV